MVHSEAKGNQFEFTPEENGVLRKENQHGRWVQEGSGFWGKVALRGRVSGT